MLVENNRLDPEPGFHKGDINNIPIIRNESIVKFVRKTSCNLESIKDPMHDIDLRVDYVQVRKEGELCEARAFVFAAATTSHNEVFVKVSIKTNNKNGDIHDAFCDQCANKLSCIHIVTFLFWLHRQNSEDSTAVTTEYWGTESELLREEPAKAIRIRDLIQCDELRLESDLEAAATSEVEDNIFFDAVMDELETVGLRDTTFGRFGRPATDEFEPLFIHHTLLDMPNNFVRDVRSFISYMEEHAKQGLFDRLAEISCLNYKSPMWLETQYMRLRCSLIHRIASRRDSLEDEQILNVLFMKGRERSIESRQQLKQHKRFILKQTEKLENKTYHECGILISECYPFICATPDGITDDHIVEIKAPRSEVEFEQYLEGRETIAPKYMAQIQIQMYVANVTKALYCVLSPTFDTNGALHYVWVQSDMEFVASLLGAADDFWRDVVFPRLASIYFAAQR